MTKYQFNEIIKKNLLESGRNTDEFGYQYASETRLYENYYSVCAFDK